jgi:hypothetical protein
LANVPPACVREKPAPLLVKNEVVLAAVVIVPWLTQVPPALHPLQVLRSV